MALYSDQHIHSLHSFDSKAKMADMADAAIKNKLSHITFTEHVDYDFPKSDKVPKGAFECNIDSYLYDLLCLREKYGNDLAIGFGVEVGLKESAESKNKNLVSSYDFDLVIASQHLLNNIDTYDAKCFDGLTDKQAISGYFEEMIKNIKSFNDFDVLGHMDYIVRTLPGGEGVYKPSDHLDYIDEILLYLINNQKSLEINTSALNKGFKNSNPHADIVKRYKEKGGELITIGSDAHSPENVGGNFAVANDILIDNGFKYMTVYCKRVPQMVKL